MARKITYESCTLVYTLLDDSVLNFNDFSLIVRSLHSFMVEDIKENAAMKNVHVKLGYQASVINAQNKLGALKNCIGISKLSSHVKECELSRLDQLRKQFGLFNGSDEQPQPGTSRGGRGARQRIFPQRQRPYTKKAAKVPYFAEIPEEDDTLPDAQPWGVYSHETTEQYFGDNTEDQQQINE